MPYKQPFTRNPLQSRKLPSEPTPPPIATKALAKQKTREEYAATLTPEKAADFWKRTKARDELKKFVRETPGLRVHSTTHAEFRNIHTELSKRLTEALVSAYRTGQTPQGVDLSKLFDNLNQRELSKQYVWFEITRRQPDRPPLFLMCLRPREALRWSYRTKVSLSELSLTGKSLRYVRTNDGKLFDRLLGEEARPPSLGRKDYFSELLLTTVNELDTEISIYGPVVCFSKSSLQDELKSFLKV